MKRFRLKKLEKTLGYTAEGIEFSNGACVLYWLTPIRSIAAIYESIEIIEFIHGYGGKVVVEWLDKDEDSMCNHEVLYFNYDKSHYICADCKKMIYQVHNGGI